MLGRGAALGARVSRSSFRGRRATRSFHRRITCNLVAWDMVSDDKTREVMAYKGRKWRKGGWFGRGGAVGSQRAEEVKFGVVDRRGLD